MLTMAASDFRTISLITKRHEEISEFCTERGLTRCKLLKLAVFRYIEEENSKKKQPQLKSAEAA